LSWQLALVCIVPVVVAAAEVKPAKLLGFDLD
jgi:hypothetical protein